MTPGIAGLLVHLVGVTMTEQKNEADETKPERKYPKNQILEWMIRMRESGILKTMSSKYLAIFFVLYSHRNPEGYAWPSQATLAEKSGCCKRTVITALKIGKACLGIKIEKKKGKKNKYFLPVHEEISSWQPSRGRKKQHVQFICTGHLSKKKASQKK